MYFTNLSVNRIMLSKTFECLSDENHFTKCRYLTKERNYLEQTMVSYTLISLMAFSTYTKTVVVVEAYANIRAKQLIQRQAY